MDSLLSDVRFALRGFARRPGFTLVAVLTLALGIGGSTAIFTVADRVLLQPLPYEEPEELVRIYTQFPNLGFERFWMSPPEYLELVEWNRSFAAVGAYSLGAANVSGGETPVRTTEAVVTSSVFDVLAVPARVGRPLTADDNLPGADPVVVVGYDFWQRALGGDTAAVGRTLEVDGEVRTLVGVMPPGFDVEDAGVEVWTPFTIDRADLPGRGSHLLNVLARRADGVSFAEARHEMAALLQRWDEEFPDTHSPNPESHAMVLEPLHEDRVGAARAPLLLLLGAVACVLLVACANVANLLLARGESRKRELAVRSVLGAGRTRLVRQLLTESVVLSLAGGAAGLFLAWVALRALLVSHPDAVPRAAEIHLDLRAALFTAAVAVVTGLLFGLAPALRTRAGRLADTIKEGGRSGHGRAARAVRRGLVVAEVALATLLVLGAGLLLRSFWNLTQVDPGFDAGGVLSFQISLPQAHYGEDHQVNAFYDRLIAELERLPGVESAAGLYGMPPVRDVSANDTEFEGLAQEEGAFPHNVDYYQVVTPGYFETMGISIAGGRGFRPADTAGSQPVVVINQQLARVFYPDQNPVGRRLRRGWWGPDAEPWYTIVGVAEDVKQGGLDEETGTELYFLHSQYSLPENASAPRTLYLAVRTGDDPLVLASAVHTVVHRLDPGLPLARVRSLEAAVSESLSRPRFLTLLVSVFAGIALLLALIGTYGVLAYGVEERRHEMGVRMALGARARDVLGLVVRQGMAPVVAGLALGLAAALALRQVLASQLFGVAATDPATFVAVPAALVAVALLACWLPGWRAAQVDPAAALREE